VGITAGVIGHTGYAGQELINILKRHSGVEPMILEAPRGGTPSKTSRTSASKALQQARQSLAQPGDSSLRRRSLEEALAGGRPDVVFLATSVSISLDLAPRLVGAGSRVIDLSGAFRLPTAASFETWYGEAHTCPELLADAVYGLPEITRERVAGCRLLANPGCYATAANLALCPLQRSGLVDAETLVVCDAKSGVSGAGKEARAATHFCTVAENISLYGLMTHRHVPEILQTSGLTEDCFSFSTQLLPVRRGILATIYFRLRPGAQSADVGDVLHAAYADEPFVEVYPEGSFPTLTSVINTNRCHLGYAVVEPGRRTLIVAALDNLLKGAAGQAVQNLNIMLGLPETDGLLAR
jgi:N-acetyl-gamma-glutamyl-phosphate reductase